MAMSFLQRMFKTSVLVLLVYFLLAFSENQTVTEQGYYLVSIDFVTNPVKVGSNDMKLVIDDAKTGRPVVKKLKIEVVPWMPAHEHVTRDIPIVSRINTGRYLVKNLNFSMQGDWEVYIKIIEDGDEDTVVFNVAVTN